MEHEVRVVAPPMAEVPMVEAEVVEKMKLLAGLGWGAKRIARELGIARNTVRRYVRDGASVGKQLHLPRRCLDEAAQAEAVRLYDGPAEGNAVVVKDLLGSQGVEAGLRTVQRAVQARRQEVRAAQAATVRFETAPGEQMQIDFGQKRVSIAGQVTVVRLLVAVLSYSRRLFVKAFLSERQDDWLEGISAAFQHFGGVPRTLLNDNPKALVLAFDAERQTAVFHPGYVAFCADWGVTPKACRPYRARTKGKTESGVKYVKRNGLAGRAFDSFAALEQHLAAWMVSADHREHGTTHELPQERFDRDERAALRPLAIRPVASRHRRLRRRVANDALIDVDTVRYSVPCQLVRETVEVAVLEQQVRVFHGAAVVAEHVRSFEPHARVINPRHYEGLLRPSAVVGPLSEGALERLGRSLASYADVIERDAA